PGNTSDEMKRYQELGATLSKADEDLLGAQADLRNAQIRRDQANADLATATQAVDQARGADEQFRGQVDTVTAESFRGGQFARLSSLMATGSTRDFLDRMSALSMVAATDNVA